MTRAAVTPSVRRPPARAPQLPPAAGRSAKLRRRLQLKADLVGTAGIALLVTVVALWLKGGGIQSFSATGGLATGIGRVTGLLASALLLEQVLLMARIPWLEGVWGQDVLARRHRLVGFTSFNLMLVHIVLITIGYAQSGHLPILSQLWSLVTTYQGMLLATAGTVALVMVVVTSVRAARRRLRYESWHLLHLYAYLGVGLALPHQLWTGADFTSSPVATVFWWGLWLAAAGAVLLFRFVLPIVRSLYHGVRVDHVRREGDGVVSVVLSGRRLDRLGVRAGQFCQWRFLGGPGWSRAHPYSLSAAPTAGLMRITAKDLGDGSRALSGLRPGTRVLLEGPYGTMTADRRVHRDALLVAAGIGITPMRALAEQIAGEAASPEGPDRGAVRRPRVTVLHRIPYLSHATFAAEWPGLSARGDVRVIPLVGHRAEGSSFFPGPSPIDPVAALRRIVPDVATREVYLCGPAPFMREVRTVLAAAGVPAPRIHAEEFAW